MNFKLPFLGDSGREYFHFALGHKNELALFLDVFEDCLLHLGS